MSTTVVISQPMLFPWIGQFEQFLAADVFVYYDDVQYARGFINRVQVKTRSGQAWLTVPIVGARHRQTIDQVALDNTQDWRASHLSLLSHEYAQAEYKNEMLGLVEGVYEANHVSLVDLLLDGMSTACSYLGLETRTARSSELDLSGRSSERLLNIVRHLGGDTYVTGHGARHYLDHEMFEQAGVRVEYMDYTKVPYPQLHGDFTPFVTVLDAIANVGKNTRSLLQPRTNYWKNEQSEA